MTETSHTDESDTVPSGEAGAVSAEGVGEPFRPVVLWEVTDCAALARTSSSEVSVRLSTLPGLNRSVPVGILTPDLDTLVDLGGC
jgi:hypothetical protein